MKTRTLFFPGDKEALVNGHAIEFDGKLETVHNLDISTILRSKECPQH